MDVRDVMAAHCSTFLGANKAETTPGIRENIDKMRRDAARTETIVAGAAVVIAGVVVIRGLR